MDSECEPSSFTKLVSTHKVGKVSYTPLELQFIEIKERNPTTILFVECGYKYRFFGEDAEIAAKELNIFCHLDHNFMTASIPTHRLHTHVSRLISKGYKVGVVKQIETAAIKAAGDNRSAPFKRRLENVYTKATFVGESLHSEDNVNIGGHLCCVYEEPCLLSDKTQELALISVNLSTGDLLYDTFSDKKSRLELETRLSHIQPVEVIYSSNVSNDTEGMVQKFASSRCEVVRQEKVKTGDFEQSNVTEMVRGWCDKLEASPEKSRDLVRLPRAVQCCLCMLLSYLEQFNLSNIIQMECCFRKLTVPHQFMHLSGRTLKNLEVFENALDQKTDGSLYWLLNRTHTRFGGRKLKRWLSSPLLDVNEINNRLDALQDILDNPSFEKIEVLLKSLPDLERGLTLIFYGKSSPEEFVSFCEALWKIEKEMKGNRYDVKSRLLQEVLTDVPNQLQGIENWVNSLNRNAAKSGDKTEVFADDVFAPDICEEKGKIRDVLEALQSHRRDVRLLLKSPALHYTTVAGTEFLVEVKNTLLRLVPNDWLKVNATKTVTRFHTPYVVEALKTLNQHRERLKIVCEEAWRVFLRTFQGDCIKYRKAVELLAALDCLFALAYVSKQHEFCRPEMLEEGRSIEIVGGSHPVVKALMTQTSQQYVPNDTHLQASGHRCMMITGPNMGGKSLYIKQVAVICLMAQIGCYVPAERARLSVIDSIHTRMGALDRLYKGQSTLMVELQEASDVMSKATERSLVVLDELGRGTSTHDGVAIAHATLSFFLEQMRCFTLFVTHYPTLVEEVEQRYPGVAANYHMSFYAHKEDEDVKSLVFLYELSRGLADRSYGLNVARLAGIPTHILKTAATKSEELETRTLTLRKKKDSLKRLLVDKPTKSEVQQILL